MKQLKFLVYGLSFLLISSAATGQNLTGVWRGIFYNPTEIAMGGSKYRYEVQINNDGRSTSGVTYSYQTTRFYGKASMVGVWSPSTKNLVLQEDKMLELKIADGGDGCLMTCYLTYRKEDGKEYLEGSYTSYNMNNKTTNCGGGRVFLEKVPDSDFELEDFLVKKPSGSTGKVKPGQEDFLVNKPPVTTTKPPVNKPPVTTTKPPVSTAKPPASGSKPPATAGKPPATAGKPPAAPKPAATRPPATAAKPPVAKPQTPPATANATVKPPAAKPQELETQGHAEIAARATEPVKPRQPVTPPPAVLKERKNELFKTITTSEKIIEISLYDNGEIDGDTISVYSNNRLVASKKGLSARPIVIKIELDNEEAQQDLVMVAENLGSIPPNTALMIVKAGDQRYTLYLSSTEQKNAMVRFRYEAK